MTQNIEGRKEHIQSVVGFGRGRLWLLVGVGVGVGVREPASASPSRQAASKTVGQEEGGRSWAGRVRSKKAVT